MKSDEEICLEVLDELRWETRISNPTATGVAVKEGVATLCGYADNLSDQYLAQNAAQSVPEVKGVVSGIESKRRSSGWPRIMPGISRSRYRTAKRF